MSYVYSRLFLSEFLTVSPSHPRRSSGPLALGLWWCNVRRPSCCILRASAGCSKRCRQSCSIRVKVWPRHALAARVTLACTLGNLSATRRRTLGDRAFHIAVARVWNSLPHDVTAAPSLPVFRRRLKTVLFGRSYGGHCWLVVFVFATT